MTEESKDREIVEAFFPDRREVEDEKGFVVIDESQDDRMVEITVPTDGQLTQMLRGISAMERASNGAQALKPMVSVLNILMLLVYRKEDREWLDNQMDHGLINTRDWEPAIRSITSGEEEAPPAPRNGPVKRARAKR